MKKKIIIVSTICILDTVPASIFIYFLKSKNQLLSVRNASENLFGIIGQNLVTVSFSILLFIAMLFILKGNFTEELYLGVKKNKKQMGTVILLAAILFALFAVLCVKRF